MKKNGDEKFILAKSLTIELPICNEKNWEGV